MLSKAAWSTIFWVFGMIGPGIEPWSPGPLANSLFSLGQWPNISMICKQFVRDIFKQAKDHFIVHN